MSDNGIIIGQIIKDSSAAEKSCTASINATQSKMDELNTKIKAIKEGVCDIAAQRLSTHLISVYGDTTSIIVTGPEYNQAYDSTGNLTQWRVLQVTCDNNVPSLPHFVVLNDRTFYTDGDMTDIFYPRLEFSDIGFGRKTPTGTIPNRRTTRINTVVYDTTTDITTVSVVDGVISGSDNVIYTYRAGHNNPIDSSADTLISQWTFAQDLLIKPMGLSGTYGLIPTRDNLSKGKDAISSNKDKNAATPGMLDSYKTVGPAPPT